MQTYRQAGRLARVCECLCVWVRLSRSQSSVSHAKMLAAAAEAVVCRAACTECEILKRQQQQEVKRGRGKFQPASLPASQKQFLAARACCCCCCRLKRLNCWKAGQTPDRQVEGGGDNGGGAATTTTTTTAGSQAAQAAHRWQQRAGAAGSGSAAQTNNASRCAVVKFSFSAAVACCLCPPSFLHCLLLLLPLPLPLPFLCATAASFGRGLGRGRGEKSREHVAGASCCFCCCRVSRCCLMPRKLASLAPDAANKVMS